jgi:hypothetical protein
MAVAVSLTLKNSSIPGWVEHLQWPTHRHADANDLSGSIERIEKKDCGLACQASTRAFFVVSNLNPNENRRELK